MSGLIVPIVILYTANCSNGTSVYISDPGLRWLHVPAGVERRTSWRRIRAEGETCFPRGNTGGLPVQVVAGGLGPVP